MPHRKSLALYNLIFIITLASGENSLQKFSNFALADKGGNSKEILNYFPSTFTLASGGNKIFYRKSCAKNFLKAFCSSCFFNLFSQPILNMKVIKFNIS